MEIKVSGKELDIIIGSVRQSIATMRSLWSGKGADMPAASNVPEELSEMENLLERLRDDRVAIKGEYGTDFEKLLARIKEDKQCGIVPSLIAKTVGEQFDDDMLYWCEYECARLRKTGRYKQNLCESKNL